MKKTIASILLVVASVLALVACNDTTTTGSTTTNATTAAGTTTVEEKIPDLDVPNVPTIPGKYIYTVGTDGKGTWTTFTSNTPVTAGSYKYVVDETGAGTWSIFEEEEGPGDPEGPEEPGTNEVINFWCWNDEFKTCVEYCYPEYKEKNDEGDEFTLKDGTKIKWTFVDNVTGGYRTALDVGLKGNSVDMFLMEDIYANKYVNSDNVVPLSKFGITDKDLSNQYDFTQDIATNGDGEIVCSSWIANPGVFAYNVAYAKAILGSEYSRARVAELTSDWLSFDALAARVEEFSGTINWETVLGADANLPNDYKASGEEAEQVIAAGDLAMLAGIDEFNLLYTSNVGTTMYNDITRNITIDSKLWNCVERTKMYFKNGYFPVDIDTDGFYGYTYYQIWSSKWMQSQSFDGKAFGLFACPWYVDYVLVGNNLNPDVTEGTQNEKSIKDTWNIVEGPESFFWGGTWIAATPTGFEKAPEVIKDIILKMTCDADVSTDISRELGHFTNHRGAMNALAKDATFVQPFLGQNTFKVYANAVETIKVVTSKYSDYIYEYFMYDMHNYIYSSSKGLTSSDDDYMDIQTAFENFNTYMREKIDFNTLVSNKVGVSNFYNEE